MIFDYLKKIESEWKTGEATEQSYRPMLKQLLEGLLPGVMVINEPSHIECGAPDYILKDKKSQLNLSFIEAKKIADADLDGKSIHKEQFNRYKDSLDSLCFTDYLDFRFYAHHDFIDSVRIAEVKGETLAPANEDELARFVQLVDHFAAVKPQHITSPSRLAQLMAGKARLLAQGVREYLKDEKHADSTLSQQMEAFRNVLIHDIDANSFADIFAQTVTYGMFAARLHDKTPEDFSRAEAAQLIPKTNPLLRQMFQYIAMDTDESIEWIVDDLVSLFAAVDVEKLMKDYGKESQKTDPLMHFYEDFLAAYDPRLRKVRGVWNTPTPVVGFIVRSVDRILEKGFGLSGGLANADKVKTKVVNDNKVKKSEKKFVERIVHKVQLLDPSLGTGTFIAETVKLIHKRVVDSIGSAAWQGYVADDLLPRLNGFEILMASYAMAHLKMDMLLAETGYVHKSDERFRIFLTNSLEPYDKETGTLFAAALSKEANEANFVKRDCPVMVVMGNPPYSGVSSNNGEWATKLVENYKKEPDSDLPLQEKKHWLNDDYVKFLSFAQYYIQKNGEGVVGFINNNGFIDNPTFRGMRWSLLKAYDEIYILNLHGNAMKKEKTPEGKKDENVFDITVGVSINILVKHKGGSNALAKVRYADLYGLRDSKYDWLNANSLEKVDWKTVDPTGPFYFFTPQNDEGREEYEKGFRIDELMTAGTSGIVSMGDSFAYADSKADLQTRFQDFLTTQYTPESLTARYSLGKNYADFVLKFKQSGKTFDEGKFKPVGIRPFDWKWTYYDNGILWRTREKVMRHMLFENLGLIALKGFPHPERAPVFISDGLIEHRYWSSSGGQGTDYIFPLYLAAENMGSVEMVPNFNGAIYDAICEGIGEKPAPEEVFYYIYGVLHAPSYRSKFKEFLKVDFPRVPYPQSAEEFHKFVAVGEKLAAVHLLKDPEVSSPFSNPYAKFEGEGDSVVEKVSFEPLEGDAAVEGLGRVWINGGKSFAPVPEVAWNAFIGGYQPAQKWLKDRKGKVLSSTDVVHYKAIVAALKREDDLIKGL